jgi:hypothetical protein
VVIILLDHDISRNLKWSTILIYQPGIFPDNPWPIDVNSGDPWRIALGRDVLYDSKKRNS